MVVGFTTAYAISAYHRSTKTQLGVIIAFIHLVSQFVCLFDGA
jgi:hypothetical protein